MARSDDDDTLGRLEGLRNLMGNTLRMPAQSYQTKLEEVRPRLEGVLADITENYEYAWRAHESILDMAEEDAETENTVRGVVIGAAASVAVSAAAAVALPTMAAFSAGWWATTAGGSVASGISGSMITDEFSVPTDFDPIVPRELGQLRQLSQLLSFEREASTAYLAIANIARRYSELDVIVDEWRAGRSAGVREEADEFLARESEIESMFNNYLDATAEVRDFKDDLEGWSAPEKLELQRAIWVRWIARLRLSDHDKLDRDVLEDHLHSIGVLGGGGVLGVDTREVWDTDKEKAAIRAARRQEDEIFQQLSGPRR